MSQPPRNRVIVGDARSSLRKVPRTSIDMVLTSPPYFRLRDYATPGQVGLEGEVEEWVTALRGIARQVHGVLTPTGSFWLNVSDTYATHPREGTGRKSLLLGPERLALALTADGWLLRNKIIWQKANPMPTSVRDRLACTWEALYVFVKQPTYFFDLDAVREPHRSRPVTKRPSRPRRTREAWLGPNAGNSQGLDAIKAAGLVGHPLGKNPGDVWRIASSNYRGGHHATFPLALAERAIRAGCPERRCVVCCAPGIRAVIRRPDGTATRGSLTPTCSCSKGSEPGIVLDPFLGAGTTAVAAEGLGRDWLGVELNPAFAELARVRVAQARAGPSRAAA